VACGRRSVKVSAVWGLSLRRNLRSMGPMPPWGQMDHICRSLWSECRVASTSSLETKLGVTVLLLMVVNFLLSASW
jgi:hypothetical protein